MFVLFSAICAAAIPKRYPALSWGVSAPKVLVELYADPLCPDCADIWPKLQQLLKLYPTQLTLSVHFIPLPYHTWCNYMVRVIKTVQDISEDKARQFVDRLYNGDQDLFSNTALQDVSEINIPNTMLTYVSKTFSIDLQELTNHYSKAEVKSAASMEYNFGALHGITGTPTIFINGVATEIGPETTIDEWKAVIDPLL